jgi:hypothetical protein
MRTAFKEWAVIVEALGRVRIDAIESALGGPVTAFC